MIQLKILQAALPVDMLQLKMPLLKLPTGINVQGLTSFHTGRLPFSTIACSRNGSGLF